MTKFVVRSYLETTDREALERLVFFNPRQHQAGSGLAKAVDVYGSPILVRDNGGVRVAVSRREDAQCLFALAPTRDGWRSPE